MPEPEESRARHDRANFADGVGVVPLELPGIEKRLARHLRLSSRVGFVRHVRPLSEEEMRFILPHQAGGEADVPPPADDTDAEALAAIARIADGDFWLVQRLFAQIGRVLEINRLRTITKGVVGTARENRDWCSFRHRRPPN